MAKRNRVFYKFTANKKKLYLDALRDGATRSQAAQIVDLSRPTIHDYCIAFPEFAELVEEAELDATDKVENALWKSAVEKGNVTAQQVWLYNRRPDRWKDKRGQPGDNPIDAVLAMLSPAVRQAILAELGPPAHSTPANPPITGEASQPGKAT